MRHDSYGRVQRVTEFKQAEKEVCSRGSGNVFAFDVVTCAWKRKFVCCSIDTRCNDGNVVGD